MTRWAVALPKSSARLLGSLRLAPGIDICAAQDDALWLRGPESDDALELRLRQLAGAERFTVLPDGQLIPTGGQVPGGALPHGPWQPLQDWMQPLPPSVGWPGMSPSKVQFQLVRDEEEREASALVATWNDWLAYASTAPQVRLDCWSFAVDGGGRVLVRGHPLPPLPGAAHVEQSGLLTPAGWTWSPAVPPVIIQVALGLRENDVALLHTDGTWELIRALDWVRATRSAIRQTAERGQG